MSSVQNNTDRKRKEVSIKKDLAWSDVMLRNIFTNDVMEELWDDIQGNDPCNNDDYKGYFRIRDGIENGWFSREEFDTFWGEYDSLPQSDKPENMARWWKSFAHDPKDMNMVDKHWVQKKFPVCFKSLEEQAISLNPWNVGGNVTTTAANTSSTLVSLKSP